VEIKKAEVEALLTQVMYQAQKAIQEKRPRFSLGFKGWGFIVEVDGGGRHWDGTV
jgi:hypothetical protein